MMKNKAHIIVVGNEKGGTGKSTIAMHLISSLMRSGAKVGSIDLDGRQGTLTRYINNRVAFMKLKGIYLPLPEHISVKPSDYNDPISCKHDEETLDNEINYLSELCDFIVIDTPGADNHLFRAGHLYADTLITPINDSLIDLDVLAKVDSETLKIVSPSHYAETIWNTRKIRATKGLLPLNWLVVRNRLFHVDSKNKKQMKELLTDLSKRIGFVPLTGIGERVIYRELFLKGLTILDIRDKGINMELAVSHISARQEIRNLTDAIYQCTGIKRQAAS